MQIVVLGSFRRHLEGILATADAFRTLGCAVLSPGAGRPVDPTAAIDQADAAYFYNPDGYLGPSAAVELGYCRAAGKRIYLLTEPADPNLRLYGGRVASPAEAVADWQALPFDERLSERASLPMLQRYVHAMVVHRGFTEVRPLESMLLMVEEVGELAKALRKTVGLKTDPAKAGSYGPLGDEFADVLIYLLALANGTGVDLAAALREKEAQNERRVWKA